MVGVEIEAGRGCSRRMRRCRRRVAKRRSARLQLRQQPPSRIREPIVDLALGKTSILHEYILLVFGRVWMSAVRIEPAFKMTDRTVGEMSSAR